MKTKKYTFINDPGHGWLSVPLDDITALGITNQITSYSYISPSRAYLEEDCDASLFLAAAKKAGWEVTYKNSYSNKSWPGRSWPAYHPYFVTHRFATGKQFALHTGAIGTVYQLSPGCYGIELHNGVRYRLRKANPLIGLVPVTGLE